MAYFAKLKVTKTVTTAIKKDTYNGDTTIDELIILGEVEFTSPTLEKLQEKIAAHANLIEE